MAFLKYQELDKRDLINHLKPGFESGRIICRHSDGEFVAITNLNVHTDPAKHGVVVRDLRDLEFVKRMETMLDGNCVARNGKFVVLLKIDYNPPWLYVRHHTDHNCFLDRSIIYNRFGIIPPRCRNCWKVVVEPRTIRELDQLHDIQIELDQPAKCGIELRKWTGRNYGGYFYNSSKEEGLAKLDMVRSAVWRKIDPSVPVYLKRACTEIELSEGRSDQWPEITDSDKDWVDYINRHVVVEQRQVPQSDLIKVHIMKEIIEYAFMHGDPTVGDYTERPLVMPALKYERGDNEKV